MFGKSKSLRALSLGLLVLAPSVALAVEEPDVGDDKGLPPPQSDNDPRPPVAKPEGGDAMITEQAGIGGTQAYGRTGVLELGGSLGLNKATDFTQFNATPSIGWFFMDNVQLSVLLGFNYIDAGGESSTLFTGLLEPSLHIPLNNSTFVFGGVGFGGAYASDPGAGFAVSPRLGMNFMVGRSGILTPSLHFNYSTSEVIQTNQGQLLAVSTSYGLNVGYTVMW